MALGFAVQLAVAQVRASVLGRLCDPCLRRGQRHHEGADSSGNGNGTSIAACRLVMAVGLIDRRMRSYVPRSICAVGKVESCARAQVAGMLLMVAAEAG